MNTLDPRELREKVQIEVKKRQTLARQVFFVISIVLFALLGSLGWIIAGNAMDSLQFSNDTLGGVIAGMILLTVGWGISILYQGILLYMDSKAGVRGMRDQIAAQVIAREQMNQLLDDPEPPEKLKRDEMYKLTDDGEIQPADLSDDENQYRSAQS